jgi:DNA-binding beta-propeller fold protein YncE
MLIALVLVVLGISRPVRGDVTASFSILAGDWAHHRILRIDPQTQQYEVLVQPDAGGLDQPTGMTLAPDGSLLVGSAFNNRILRFDLGTGAPLGVFADVPLPIGMKYGPGGDLYVASRNANAVLRFDGVTGAPKGTVATADNGTLWWAWDLQFRPGDDKLLLSSFERGSVLKFDPATGTYDGPLVSPGPGYASGLAFGPDGDLFVARFGANVIDRFDEQTGAFKGTFAAGNGLFRPTHLAFAPDGRLYVANERSPVISMFDAATGAPLGTIAVPGDVNTGIEFLLVIPEPASGVLVLVSATVALARRRCGRAQREGTAG